MNPRLPFFLALVPALLAASAWLAGCAAAPGKVRSAGSAVTTDSTVAAPMPPSGRPGQPGQPATSGSYSAAKGIGRGAERRTQDGAGSVPVPVSPAGTDSAGRPLPSTVASAKTDSAKSAAKAAPAPKDQAPPRGEPLIMENADRMEGFQKRGEYILSGKVRFVHGDLRLETERAVWLKDRSVVYAESGMRITHRGALLTSDRGSYDKNMGQAMAEGRVRMRDSSGEVEASGHNVTYLRFQHIATLSGNPEVRRYYRKPPDTAASAAAAPAAVKATEAKAPGEIIDTLVIRGKVLTFNDSSQVAVADGDVRITRKKVDITCQKAEYHDRADSLYLVGEPLAKFDESQVKGVMMKVGMTGEEIRSLLVKGDAQAKSMEPATDTSAARQSDVFGDSLYMAFKDQAIDSVQVFRNAKGSYFDLDKPDYVNRMSGDYMVLRFVNKQVSSANVLGGAKSTYFHLEKKVFKGRNEAEGDTIEFAFKSGKVDEVLVRGQSKGTYFGEPSRKRPGAKNDTGSAPADSLEAPAGKPSAVVPPAAPPALVPAASKPAPAPKGGVPAGSPAPPEAGGGGRKEPERTDQPYNPWRKK